MSACVGLCRRAISYLPVTHDSSSAMASATENPAGASEVVECSAAIIDSLLQVIKSGDADDAATVGQALRGLSEQALCASKTATALTTSVVTADDALARTIPTLLGLLDASSGGGSSGVERRMQVVQCLEAMSCHGRLSKELVRLRVLSRLKHVLLTTGHGHRSQETAYHTVVLLGNLTAQRGNSAKSSEATEAAAASEQEGGGGPTQQAQAEATDDVGNTLAPKAAVLCCEEKLIRLLTRVVLDVNNVPDLRHAAVQTTFNIAVAAARAAAAAAADNSSSTGSSTAKADDLNFPETLLKLVQNGLPVVHLEGIACVHLLAVHPQVVPPEKLTTVGDGALISSLKAAAAATQVQAGGAADVDTTAESQLKEARVLAGLTLQSLGVSHGDTTSASSVCAVCSKTGATKTCSRCKQAKYCSRACQVFAWKNGHKKACGGVKKG